MHALDAVDLLLKRDRDRRLDRSRVCTHVVAGDRDLRRRQVRIQRNRQGWNADCACQDDQQRTDCGKIGRLMKKSTKTAHPLPAAGKGSNRITLHFGFS